MVTVTVTVRTALIATLTKEREERLRTAWPSTALKVEARSVYASAHARGHPCASFQPTDTDEASRSKDSTSAAPPGCQSRVISASTSGVSMAFSLASASGPAATARRRRCCSCSGTHSSFHERAGGRPTASSSTSHVCKMRSQHGPVAPGCVDRPRYVDETAAQARCSAHSWAISRHGRVAALARHRSATPRKDSTRPWSSSG
eukprot:scaffold128276_cov66-Phaeocystis_antarctica.AAC.1